MRAGDRIFIGLQPNVLYPQEGGGFATTEWGFDVGELKYETLTSNNPSTWPKRGQPSQKYPFMFITDVVPYEQESGITEIVVRYKGLKVGQATQKTKERILPGSTIGLWTVPAVGNVKFLLPVPKDTCVREFVTTIKPTRNGVGMEIENPSIQAPFLGTPAPWDGVVYTPDPAEPLTVNLRTGWVLEDRSWESVVGPNGVSMVHLVRESYGYYNPIST